MLEQVDFYLLKSGPGDARYTLACRVAEKAYNSGRRVFLHCPDDACARMMDDLLWTYSQSTFLPHSLAGDDDDPAQNPIVVGTDDGANSKIDDVLITLAAGVPEFVYRFKRVLDPVGADEADKALGRKRFRIYRERGLEPEIHTL